MNTEKNPFTGGAEEFLLDVFSGQEYQKQIEDILRNNPSWPLRYHLSPLRANLLSWFPFGTKKTILEIGAGCGALTGVLLGDENTVTAIELSENRSAVIRARHKEARERLTIIHQSFEHFVSEQLYNVVTSIGVFEYTGAFFESPRGPQDFLEKAHSLLQENGVFILAIENKFGIKYWAGAKEDHTGNYFESIEGYPAQRTILTYGRIELEQMLKAAGFRDVVFYYPFPDYKLPVEIFSDDYLPSARHMVRKGILPTQDYSQSRVHLFREERAMEGIVANDMFPFFANSFLVFAYK